MWSLVLRRSQPADEHERQHDHPAADAKQREKLVVGQGEVVRALRRWRRRGLGLRRFRLAWRRRVFLRHANLGNRRFGLPLALRPLLTLRRIRVVQQQRDRLVGRRKVDRPLSCPLPPAPCPLYLRERASALSVVL